MWGKTGGPYAIKQRDQMHIVKQLWTGDSGDSFNPSCPDKEKQRSLFSPAFKILAPKYFIIGKFWFKKIPRREKGCGGGEEERELFKWWSNVHCYYLEVVAIKPDFYLSWYALNI